MMRRIELLPASHAERQRERRNLGLVVIVGLVVALVLLVYWFMLGGQIATERNNLADVQARNQALEAQIADLQRFADLQAEVQGKVSALVTVFAGDVAWPSVLNDVAMVLPGEVWLTNMTSSAGVVEGATPVGTETAEIRVAQETPFGRVQFQGSALSMPGVAKWLIRQAGVDEFQAVWLNSATTAEGVEGAQDVVSFDTTIELNTKASSVLQELDRLLKDSQ